MDTTKKTRMSRGKKRPVAGRDAIMETALAIGIQKGWKAVTIRSVAQHLGYASPLLYEHFQNKEDLLTQIAVRGLSQMEAALMHDLPEKPVHRIARMAERYWDFILEHTSLYRLMNGMDGAWIDHDVMRHAAHAICAVVAAEVRPLLHPQAGPSMASQLSEELWALLHGMAALHLDRDIPFARRQIASACIRFIHGTNTDTSSRPVI